MSREFDIVVFGATGFTGRFVVEELSRQIHQQKLSVKLGAAGRNEDRVRNALRIAASNVRDDSLSTISIIAANTLDFESLKTMTSRTRILINCTGPFRFHGEQVVEACIATRTDYVDISGEPQFFETIVAKHSKAAQQAECLIVPTCGFDCIPAEIGTLFATQQYSSPSQPCFVEAFISLDCSHPNGPGIHYTTYEALIHSMGNVEELRKLRRDHPQPRLILTGPKLERHNGLFFDNRVNKWCFPFMGADAAIVKSSQREFLEHPEFGQHSVQFATYITLPGFGAAMKFLFYGGLFTVLSKFEDGRNWMLKHPEFISCGFVTHQGPSDEQIAQTKFNMTFFSSGFSDGLPSDSRRRPDVSYTTEFSGPEPGYRATPICVVAAALSLLDDRQSSPVQGGIYSPAVVFCRSEKFKQRLQASNEIKIRVVQSGAAGYQQ